METNRTAWPARAVTRIAATLLDPQDNEDTVLVATYLGVPDDGESTTPVDEAEAQALDDECDIDTPSP